MIARLVLLFLLLPVIEFFLFIQLERVINLWPTIGLIIVTGIVGGYLARREGASTWKRLNERLQTGALPGNEIVDGVIILVSGALLVTPGVLTDVVGFLGLVPPSRRLIRKFVMKRIKKKMEDGTMGVQYGGFYGDPDDFSMGGVEGPAGPDDSEAPGENSARWDGSGRQVPGHADEVDDAPSGSKPRNGIQ